MLTTPLCRPLAGPLVAAITDARVSAPAEEAGLDTTWDAATKQADVTLSGGDLVASTTQFANYANVRSTESHESGKYVIKFTVAYPGAASDQEIFVGLCATAWDPATNGDFLGNDADGWSIDCQGFTNNNGTGDSGLPSAATGGDLRAFYNATTGKVWFGNGATVDGDPEAGTGEAFTLAPGTALYFAATMYSNDAPTPASVTIDPTYTSGTFAAWNTPE